MISQLLPSTLSRNHYLEQSFARILRDNDISINDIDKVINEIDAVQLKSIQVDPDYLDDNESFNPETVNAYCYACKIDFVYDIMENVPVIKKHFIDKEHYNHLNSFSPITVTRMGLNLNEKPKTYFELKTLIRNLTNNHVKSTIVFSLKKLFVEEWEYLDKNDIVRKIINKTRRKKNET